MISMTGYGKAEYIENGIGLTVEIRTVNNRNFDFNAKMPRAFFPFESGIRKIVSSYVSRARVECFISFYDKRDNSGDVAVDFNRAQSYYKWAVELSEKLGVPNDVTAVSLLKMPLVLSDEAEIDVAELESVIYEVATSACENLNKMRRAEGEKLVADMLSRMNDIEALRLKIIGRAPLVATEYRTKLEERIKDILGNVDYDQSRLLSEVAFYTDRVNIDEELTRLGSHINQFREIISQERSGKKLDFLMQEFNRETNTICSKSNDIEVTRLALSLKNEIEKVREQVQNLE